MKFHIVQKNESLWSIAKKYGVDFEQLKMANGQLSNPNVLMPGMKVKVPTDHVKEQQTHHKHEHVKKEEQKHPFVEQKEHKKEVQKPTPKPEAIKPQPVPKPTPPPKKEQPKHIYHQPIMPYLPEIDINNYYTMNMNQMQQQLTQPQLPIQPPVQPQSPEEPPKDQEMPEHKHEHTQPYIPQPCIQQPYYVQPQQPICDPCYPYPQPQYDPCYPYQQPMPYPMQQVPLPGMTQPFQQTNWNEESSHIGYMPTNQQQAFVPQYQPSQMPQYMSPQMPQYVQQPYYPMPNQPFYGYGMNPSQAMPAYRPFVNEGDDEVEREYE